MTKIVELICRACKREWSSDTGSNCKGCGVSGETIIVTIDMTLVDHAASA